MKCAYCRRARMHIDGAVTKTTFDTFRNIDAVSLVHNTMPRCRQIGLQTVHVVCSGIS